MRLRGRRWSRTWLRSLGRQVGLRLSWATCFVILWMFVSKAQASTSDEIVEALPPTDMTRKITKFSGGKLLIEYYPKDHAVCNSWILVPAENIWPMGLRIVLYFTGLVYVFLGVAIISDIFMSGIEKITSAKERVKVDSETGEKKVVVVEVWNETVANLTLLALGSSAPEILLSVIETLSTLDSTPGELGPSTIVGSAAFNLLCISAVCMYVSEEVKKVKEFGVFVITTVASFFAYVWMIIVLLITSECEVTIAEGIATLLFFPSLVLIAWLQDKSWFCFRSTVEQRILSVDVPGASSQQQVQEIWKKIKKDKQSSHLNDAEAEAKLAIMADKEIKSGKFGRAVYRMNAVRQAVTKAKRLLPSRKDHQEPSQSIENTGPQTTAWGNSAMPNSKTAPRKDNSLMAELSPVTSSNVKGILQWSSSSYTVLENEGHVRLTIKRYSGSEDTVTVKYMTQDGTAVSGLRYDSCSGHIVLEKGEVVQHVLIPIIDDKQYQDNEIFYVILQEAGGGAELGPLVKAAVTIIDDDQPGDIEFSEIAHKLQSSTIDNNKLRITVPESRGFVALDISRKSGSDGKVSVVLKTASNSSAIPGTDYTPLETVLDFDHTETSKFIKIELNDQMEYQKLKTFTVELQQPLGGCSIGAVSEAIITIVEDEAVKLLIDKVVTMNDEKNGKIREKIETKSWGQQIKDAMTLEEEDEELTFSDYAMHFLTMLWKIIFSTVPPTCYAGGWATFAVALMYIALVTALVAELASLFGCVVGLEDSVTAITFVALGTSLPDTFASKTAIEEEEFADAAIGNVMGSNSVNVFLGLGLPWTIASIYKEVKGETYFYPSAGLVFSVIIFLICAVCGVCVLLINKRLYGGELGGPMRRPFAAVLFCLWV